MYSFTKRMARIVGALVCLRSVYFLKTKLAKNPGADPFFELFSESSNPVGNISGCGFVFAVCRYS